MAKLSKAGRRQQQDDRERKIAADVAARLTGQPLVEADRKEVARAEELERLREKKKEIEKEIDELSPQVLRDIEKHDGLLVHGDEWKLVKIDSTHTQLSKEALLAAGVKPTVIEAATVKTPYSYPRLIRKSEKADVAPWRKGKGKR